MSLRVLLADESPTIKKVMQLALQDLDVEVKAVPLGIDVLSVAQAWRPDICFIDVLLSKVNGYEVCGQLKAQPELSQIPIVLMWSSFMELDTAKFNASKAQDKLEKPFDADTLRDLVKKHVVRLQSNAIAQFISFPDLPPFIEDQPPTPLQPSQLQASDFPPPPSKPPPVAIKIDEVQLEDFEEVRFKKPAAQPPASEMWAQQTLTTPKPQNPPSNNFGIDEIELVDLDNHEFTPISRHEDLALNAPSQTAVNESRAEAILIRESREVLEQIAWKIMPEICERIIKEEIQKLLKDSEKLEHR